LKKTKPFGLGDCPRRVLLTGPRSGFGLNELLGIILREEARPTFGGLSHLNELGLGPLKATTAEVGEVIGAPRMFGPRRDLIVPDEKQQGDTVVSLYARAAFRAPIEAKCLRNNRIV
jgi:hypothetical protein